MDTTASRPRWRFNLAYRALPRLSLGLEFNAAAAEIVPTANWIAHPETERMPLVSFGTSSDRIFTPEGYQAVYATVAKGIPRTPFAPYVGVSYSGYEQRLLFPCGVNVAINDQFDLLPMYDGRKTHLLLTHKMERQNITIMLIDLKRPKLGISIGFGF